MLPHALKSWVSLQLTEGRLQNLAVPGSWERAVPRHAEPQWSPDGSAILFDAYPDATRGLRILVLSLDSRAVSQLIPEAVHPALTGYIGEHAVRRPLP